MRCWRTTSFPGRRFLLANLALASLALLACSHGKRPALKQVAPVLLAELALAPADLGDQYMVESDGYRDQDGNPVSTPSRDFARQLRSRNATPGAVSDAVATNILITLGEQGESGASEFVDVADDADVGPPNLADYIGQRFQGSHDVRAELVDDFPSYDDATVANRITWQQDVNGTDETIKAYGVYIRSGGLLALVALRAPAEANGSEPEGLRRQAETVVHKQADKLTGPLPAQIAPRSRAKPAGAAGAGKE